MDKPNYYAIIPANVRYDSRLKSSEKLLYGEITSLANQNGKCWASNRYFANLYGVTITSVSMWIKHLEDLGYIKTEIEYLEGGKQIDKRIISITPIKENLHTPIKKLKTPSPKKLKTPPQKNLKENNTSNNNTSINNINNTLSGKPDVKNTVQEIVTYLNMIAGKNFRINRDKTKRLIEARLKEGFTVEDIKQVIDKKSKQWKGTDMDMYLRPDTLFGNKFEGYLNEKENVTRQNKVPYQRQRREEHVPEWAKKQTLEPLPVVMMTSDELEKRKKKVSDDLSKLFVNK